MIENPPHGAVTEAVVLLIAEDLRESIAGLGYPVGLGIAPSPQVCTRAAELIVSRIKDRALELLAERKAP
jgi:hypothetical protein